MRMKWTRICISAILALVCLMHSAMATETVRGDLSERFDSISEKYEYNGVTYRQRKRTNAVLAMAIDTNEEGMKLVRFARLLVVDDANKVFSMMNIPENTLIQVDGDAEGEIWQMRFSDVYQLSGTPEENCERLCAAVNRMLEMELVEDYLAFDLEGGMLLNGGEALQGTTREKLHALEVIADQMSLDEFNDRYSQLADYIITNMKSGAVMKIVDKADRYERAETVELPGQDTEAQNAICVFAPDAEKLEEEKIALFYEEDPW